MRSHAVRIAAGLAVVAVAVAVAGAVTEVWWLTIGAALALVGATLVAVVWAGVRVQTLRARDGDPADRTPVPTSPERLGETETAIEANRVLQAALTARLERLERAVAGSGGTGREVDHER